MNQLKKSSLISRNDYRSVVGPRNSQGQVLVEFLLVIPLILFIAFAVLDVTRALQVKQAAHALSREVASIAYRDCSQIETENCLTLVQDMIVKRATQTYPGATVVISIYEYDSSAGNITPHGPIGGISHYNLAALNQTDNNIGNLIRSQKVVAIGEISVPFESILKTIVSFNGRIFSSGISNFYDVTVL